MSSKISAKVWSVFVLMVLMGCSESKYTRMVKKELASGLVYDSLFLGHTLGQTRQEFFEICWDLNRDKKVTNSEVFPFVKYPLPKKATSDSEKDMTLLFYGDFNEEKTIMTGMKLQFYYDAWALWNKSLHADQLLLAVKDTLEKWYPGNEFIRVPIKKDSAELLVKVDGNRRITIKPLDDNRLVKAKIDDLRYVLDRE